MMITCEYDIKALIKDYYFTDVEELKNKIYLFKQVKEKSAKEITELIEAYNIFLSNSENRDIFIKNYASLVNTIIGLYDEFKKRELPLYPSEDLLTLIAVYSYKAFIDERFLIPFLIGDNITTDLRRFSTLLYHFYNFFVNPMRADEIMAYIGDKAFFLRLMDEFSNRICESVVGKSLFTLLFDNSKEGFDTLMRIVKKKIPHLYIPTLLEEEYEDEDEDEGREEKDNELRLCIAELLATQIKAKTTPFEFMVKAMDQRFNWFPKAVQNRFKDTITEYNRQKRRFPREMKRVDIDGTIKEKDDDDLDDLPVSEIIPDPKESIPTIRFALTESIREYFKAKYGEKAVELLEFMLENPDITKKKEIAKGVNCHPNTVTKYFKLFRAERLKLLEIFG